MKNKLATYRAQLKTLEAFAAAYPNFPEDVGTLGMCDVLNSGPYLNLYLQEGPDPRREQMLMLAGDTFGRTLWTSKMNYNRNAFEWTTERMGVKITIHSAALIDEPRVSFPVPSNAFPIQLQDVAPTADGASNESRI